MFIFSPSYCLLLLCQMTAWPRYTHVWCLVTETWKVFMISIFQSTSPCKVWGGTGLLVCAGLHVGEWEKHETSKEQRGKSQGPSQNKFQEMEKAPKEKGFGLGNCKQRQSLPLWLYQVWLQWGSILCKECHSSQHRCLQAVSLQGAGDRNCLWGGMAAAGNEKGHPPACSLVLHSRLLPGCFCLLLHRSSTEKALIFPFQFSGVARESGRGRMKS